MVSGSEIQYRPVCNKYGRTYYGKWATLVAARRRATWWAMNFEAAENIRVEDSTGRIIPPPNRDRGTLNTYLDS